VVESPYQPIRPIIVAGAAGYDVINFKLNPALPTDKSLALAEKVFKK